VLSGVTVGSWFKASLFLAFGASLSCASAATERQIAAVERPPLPARGGPRSRSELAAASPAVESSEPADRGLRPPEERELATRVELENVERAALLRHPALREGASRVRSLAQTARAEAALPPPELIAELWQVPLERPYAIDDAGMLMFGLRQHVPAAGSLDDKARASASEARGARALLIQQTRSLLREVGVSFADYAEAVEKEGLYLDHLRLLESVKAAAQARYPGGGSLADLTRAELQRARVVADLAAERGRLSDSRARLNGLMARPPGAPLGAPVVGEARTAARTKADLDARALRDNPEIERARAMKSAADGYADAAASESRIPALTVGVNYFHPVGGMPAGWGASFAMSLPWLWGEASHRYASAEERARAEAAAIEGARLRVRTETLRALVAVRAAEARWLALRDAALPGARKALDALRAAYATGGSDVLSLLDAQRGVLDISLELAAARGDLERALVELDAWVGARVPRVALGSREGGTR
jgi:outer membrane protein, heavy metal efflux system